MECNLSASFAGFWSGLRRVKMVGFVKFTKIRNIDDLINFQVKNLNLIIN